MLSHSFARLALTFAVLTALSTSPRSSRAAEPRSSLGPGIINGGFEEQNSQGKPTGWLFPLVLENAGYRVALQQDNPFAGKSCLLLDATAIEPSPGKFGNLMQSIDATPFRGKRVRFRAAVRTAELSAEGRAQLWFRVDRAAEGGQNRRGAWPRELPFASRLLTGCCTACLRHLIRSCRCGAST